MPRTLPAALTTVMDAGIYEPYIRVVINITPTDAGSTTVQPLGYHLGPLSATIVLPFQDLPYFEESYFRIVRGAVINGTPSTISSIWFKTIHFEVNAKTLFYGGEPLDRDLLSIAINSTYQGVIEATLTGADRTIVPSYEGAAAWKAYKFYAASEPIILNPRKKLFNILQQKYLVFATEDGWDGTNSNMFFFVAGQTRAQDYIVTDQLFNFNYHAEHRNLIWKDETGTEHQAGTLTDPIFNLGYLESTASDPASDARPVDQGAGSRSSKIAVNLKYRTGDYVYIQSTDFFISIRILVTEVLDLSSTPAWYQVIEHLPFFNQSEGGTYYDSPLGGMYWLTRMPQYYVNQGNDLSMKFTGKGDRGLHSGPDAPTPYRSRPPEDDLGPSFKGIHTGRFTKHLSHFDSNIQSAFETLDKHDHTDDLAATIHAAAEIGLTADDEIPIWEDTSGELRKVTGTGMEAFVDSAIGNALLTYVFLGTSINCSANPNYPAAATGTMKIVTAAGKIGGGSGKSVDVGDAILCIADNAGGNEAAVGTSWIVIEHNLVSGVDYAPAAKGVTNGDSHDHNGGDGAAITDANLSTSDITTNDASTSKHGFIKKLDNNSSHFMDGTGAWDSPLAYEVLPAHGLNGTIAAGATQSLPPFFYGLNATRYNVKIPRGGTLKNLSMVTNSAQPGTGTLVATVYVNNVATAIVATVAAGGAAQTAQDTTHTVAVSAGDLVAWDVKNNASSASAQIGASSLELELSTT